MRPPEITTSLGEIRSRLLEDGTLVMLNSGSRLVLHYTEDRRRVVLKRGEVSFDVASDKARPFVVESTNAVTEAVGTKFIVRSQPRGSAVTLLEGKVFVGPPAVKGALRISGIVEARKPRDFAQGVALTNGLQASVEDGVITISGEPHDLGDSTDRELDSNPRARVGPRQK